MINIKNRQKKIPINENKIRRTVRTILDELGYNDFDIGLLFTTNKTIKKYNRIYRHKDIPTDILSFPYHGISAGKSIIPASEDDKNLGDIIISLEYVKKDISQWNQTLEERIPILLIHGICHLLGYDHLTDTDYKQMMKKEKILLNLLK